MGTSAQTVNKRKIHRLADTCHVKEFFAGEIKAALDEIHTLQLICGFALAMVVMNNTATLAANLRLVPLSNRYELSVSSAKFGVSVTDFNKLEDLMTHPKSQLRFDNIEV